MKADIPYKRAAEQGPIVGNALSAAFMIGLLTAIAGFSIATIIRVLI